jgi:hypothetical protein
LGFNACCHLFDNHAARFTLPASTAGGESHHAKSNDTLGFESKLHSLEDHWEPGIEHRAPFAGEGLKFNDDRRAEGKRNRAGIAQARMDSASTHASAWVDANGVNVRFGS